MVFAVFYFIGGIALAVSAGEWNDVEEDHDDPPSRFGRITTSLEATAVCHYKLLAVIVCLVRGCLVVSVSDQYIENTSLVYTFQNIQKTSYLNLFLYRLSVSSVSLCLLPWQFGWDYSFCSSGAGANEQTKINYCMQLVLTLGEVLYYTYVGKIFCINVYVIAYGNNEGTEPDARDQVGM